MILQASVDRVWYREDLSTPLIALANVFSQMLGTVADLAFLQVADIPGNGIIGLNWRLVRPITTLTSSKILTTD